MNFDVAFLFRIRVLIPAPTFYRSYKKFLFHNHVHLELSTIGLMSFAMENIYGNFTKKEMEVKSRYQNQNSCILISFCFRLSNNSYRLVSTFWDVTPKVSLMQRKQSSQLQLNKRKT